MPRHLLLRGAVLPIDQLLLLKRKNVTENNVVNSLAAWLTFDQLSCEFENIEGRDALHLLKMEEFSSAYKK